MRNNPGKNDASLIYGIRPAIEAIRAGKEIERIVIQQKLRGEGFQELFALIRELEIPFQYVPPERLNHITRKNHQGVITFLSPVAYHRPDQIIPSLFEQGKLPLILILDHLTDVRNFGAIARTAECAGADALVIPDKGAAAVTADAIKTSAGALYNIPVIRTASLKETVIFLRESGLTIMAATEKTALPYTLADFKVPAALIMGSEGTGVSEDLLKISHQLISIPVFGDIASLNVSVAAGILLYEVIRQRNPIS